MWCDVMSYLDMMLVSLILLSYFVFKQKTAYEMRISDWISDVFSSDLPKDESVDSLTDPKDESVDPLTDPKDESVDSLTDPKDESVDPQIGRESCRERV